MRYLQLLVFSTLLFGALHADYIDVSTVFIEAHHFMEYLTAVIVSKSDIDSLFQDDFHFKGCSGNVDKSKVVELLTNLKGDPPFVRFGLKKAELISPKLIQFHADIFGNINTQDVQLVINRETHQLVTGKSSNCTRNLIGEVVQPSDYIVNKFLENLGATLSTRNVAHLAIFFEDGFLFQGCKGIYGKNQVVEFLAKMPKEAKPIFNVVWSRSIGNNTIEYQVTSRGVGPKEITAIFYLRVVNNVWVLNSGRMAQCY
uniref:NTF2-like domain-containing protein n=1 Tax=Caenorhabditis japonica TaxID=281687 RepID=A0A8R1E4T7_CAEJA